MCGVCVCVCVLFLFNLMRLVIDILTDLSTISVPLAPVHNFYLVKSTRLFLFF